VMLRRCVHAVLAACSRVRAQSKATELSSGRTAMRSCHDGSDAPRALEPIVYRVVVQDKKQDSRSRRVRANLRHQADVANTSDGFRRRGARTYSGRLFFATSGDWPRRSSFGGRESALAARACRLDPGSSCRQRTRDLTRDMQHFFRTQLIPTEVLRIADEFFPRSGWSAPGTPRALALSRGSRQASAERAQGRRTLHVRRDLDRPDGESASTATPRSSPSVAQGGRPPTPHRAAY